MANNDYARKQDAKDYGKNLQDKNCCGSNSSKNSASNASKNAKNEADADSKNSYR